MDDMVFTAVCASIVDTKVRSLRLSSNLWEPNHIDSRILRGSLLLHVVACNKSLVEVICDKDELSPGQYQQILANVKLRNVDRFVEMSLSAGLDSVLRDRVLAHLLVEQIE